MPINNNEDNDHNHIRHHSHGCSNPSDPPFQSPKRNPKFISLILKAAIMIFIISLFFLFLGIAAIALLHFLAAGGRRRSSLLPVDSSGTSYSVEEIQRFLPAVKYVIRDDRLPEKECAVCLESFATGEWCRSLPACRHMFHAGCVDKWLTKAANCPICRTHVRLNPGSIRPVMGDDERQLLWAVGA